MIPPVHLKLDNPALDSDSALGKAMAIAARSPEQTKDREWCAAEIPASNGHGNARSAARVATALACGGELDGIRLLGMETIEKSIEEQCYGKDLVLGVPVRWGFGWALKSKEAPVGPNPRTFYWGGWGGSAVVMDLDAKLSFSYVMNRMTSDTVGDNRAAGPAMALFSEIISGASA